MLTQKVRTKQKREMNRKPNLERIFCWSVLWWSEKSEIISWRNDKFSFPFLSIHRICSRMLQTHREQSFHWAESGAFVSNQTVKNHSNDILGFYVMNERIVWCSGNPCWKSGFISLDLHFTKLSLFNFSNFFFSF